jgi:hypothetical protein
MLDTGCGYSYNNSIVEQQASTRKAKITMNAKATYEVRIHDLETEASGIRYEIDNARRRFVSLTKQLHEETARLVSQADVDFDSILNGGHNTLYSSPADVAMDSIMRQLQSVTFKAARLESELLSTLQRIDTLKEVWGDCSK